MKKFIGILISAAVAVSAASVYAADTETVHYNYLYNTDSGYTEENSYIRRMEKLDRGLVAVKSENGVYLSWRLFSSEDINYGSAQNNVSFNVYRDGKKIAEVTDRTNFTDSKPGTEYSVAPVTDGQEGEKCSEVSVWNNNYIDIPLDRPETETVDYIDESGNTRTIDYSFSPADCSTGDLDGDGEYEIIVKWVSAEKDVGSPGDPAYSGTVRFAAYKLDGTKMWTDEINLGRNVYSSAHTVQFLVYDFDGDGKSELICQTSLGSKDASGMYVSHSAAENTEIAAFTDEQNETADFRAPGWGLITSGEEFLTVFSGETGTAIDTIDLPTARGGDNGAQFGDTSGNRSNRFLANVAYLDGENPYAVYLRGYYFGRNSMQRTSIAGIRFDGERLYPDYRFDTQEGQPGYYDGAYKYVGNGNHNCTVADVDSDGRDEFITGALCMEVNDNNEFKPRWCTFMEHGDALHIGDYDPTHPGFEFFTVHEDSGPNNMSGETVEINFGMSVIDANTGEIMFHESAGDDTGRGVMANVGAGGFYQIWSARNSPKKSNGGKNFSEISLSGASQNSRIFWDGDLYDELLDRTRITSWNGSEMTSIFNADGCTSINGTKAPPALSADLFGDWREEVVFPTRDGNYLRVYTTTIPSEYKIKTLMQDPVYRSGVAAEQTAYNQPPHVGFYMGDEIFDAPVTKIEITSLPDKTVFTQGESFNAEGLTVKAYLENGVSKDVTSYTISGYDSSVPGDQAITVSYRGVTATFDVAVKELTGIRIVSLPDETELYEGQPINTNGLVVLADFADGTSKEITDYAISGYNPEKLGSQTIYIEYMGKAAAFNINVKSGNILGLNNSYVTSLSSRSEIPIGSFADEFTITHTVKINSMPADGNGYKGSTDGFFFRFMANGQTGGGWYLTRKSATSMNIAWKNTRSNNITTLNVGEIYTFKYEFSNVGNGKGASVNMTITDSQGNVTATAENLNLRNFSDTDSGKASPITKIEIFNQAREGSTADVEINNAAAYGTGTITSVSGKKITVNLNTISNMKLYAVKYDENGLLTGIDEVTPAKTGKRTVSADFEPDKVFLWTSQQMPIDLWVRNAE